jgi:hypothetical protein
MFWLYLFVIEFIAFFLLLWLINKLIVRFHVIKEVWNIAVASDMSFAKFVQDLKLLNVKADVGICHNCTYYADRKNEMYVFTQNIRDAVAGDVNKTKSAMITYNVINGSAAAIGTISSKCVLNNYKSGHEKEEWNMNLSCWQKQKAYPLEIQVEHLTEKDEFSRSKMEISAINKNADNFKFYFNSYSLQNINASFSELGFKSRESKLTRLKTRHYNNDIIVAHNFDASALQSKAGDLNLFTISYYM